ncbi:YncE family protein [Nocardiopsis coralliicola]
MGGPTENNVSTVYLGERFIRHPLTGRNMKELDIAAKAAGILERDREKLKRKAERKGPDGRDRTVFPTGFSLNKVRFGDYPADRATAHARGWRAYMTVGVPLVDERSDVAQPPPDVVSKQTYVNRTDPTPTTWSHTVEFSVSNTISWSLQGQVQLTFGAKSTASLQSQLQQSMAMMSSQKTTGKNSKDNQGVDVESQAQATSTTTATGTATGTGELSAELMLGITASVSGSVTTGFSTSSTLSGEVGSRVDVLATQRRQVRRFDYEFPISFGGWVALYYPEPVEVKETRPNGPQEAEPEYSAVLAWKLGESGGNDSFDLTDEGRPFLQRGEAELVSTLAGEHQVFELEKLHFDEKDHPLHKPDEQPEPLRPAPEEVASGFGRAEGLAVDAAAQKAYIADRNGGSVHRVDLATGGTDWTVTGLSQPNDVALDSSGGTLYIAEYTGRRVVALSVADHTAERTEVASGFAAYGVAVDSASGRLYATDVGAGTVLAFGTSSLPAAEQRRWSVARAAGVALHGGRLYVGQYNLGELWEIDPEAAGGEPEKVAAGLGESVRLAIGGSPERAYVSHPSGRTLREVAIADGADKGFHRAVVQDSGQICGVALDRPRGLVYYSTRQGALLRAEGVLAAQ